MKATLKSLRETKANPAVSIFVKTHREHPANDQDPIALKNQLKVVEERLNSEYDKRCLLYTSPSPRDRTRSRMPSSA